MPYMQSRGDYLGGGYQRGDPGLFGFLGGIAKRIFKGSPVGQVVSAAGTVITRGRGTLPRPRSVGGPAGFQQVPEPGVTGVVHRAVKGGHTGYIDQCIPRGYHVAKDGSGRILKNRTMNVANDKALKRAIRRNAGFVKLAARSLKGTGYKIVRR